MKIQLIIVKDKNNIWIAYHIIIKFDDNNLIIYCKKILYYKNYYGVYIKNVTLE